MILFDFDGVLLDSAREAAVTAYIAATGTLATGLDQLPGNAASLFLRNRFHFQPAGDAIALMAWCLAESDPGRILTAEEFRTVIDSPDLTPIKDRTRHFFRSRERFVEADRDTWTRLNAPYQPLWAELIRRGAENLVVLTNKNREAVIDLTHAFELRVVPGNVYSGDEGVTKCENLVRIAERFPGTEFTFVDDCLNNLHEVGHFARTQGLALRCALASWGYTGSGDAAAALTHRYEVWTQQDLIASLAAEDCR